MGVFQDEDSLDIQPLTLGSPERVSSRYEKDEETRQATGFTNSTYKSIFDRFDREGADVRPVASPPSPENLDWPCRQTWPGEQLLTL